MSKNIYYYATGNTAKGYINFVHTNIKGIEQVIVLNHPSFALKTAVLKSVISTFEEDVGLEILCSPFGEEYIEGIINRKESFAILTNMTAVKESMHTKIVNIEDLYLNMNADQSEIDNELFRANHHRQRAYAHFSKGLGLHDNLEGIYINEMNFSKADQIAENFIADLLQNVSKQNRTSNIYRRFFGTNTAVGPINIVPKIIGDLSRRVYIKGRAGTGKSVFMKKVAKACEGYGLDIELYHCSFDPGSIDMVLVPELDFCIFDSTDPHEYSPLVDGDLIIDLYDKTVTPGTDEKYATEIKDVTQQYKAFLKKGTNSLNKAKLSQDKIEQLYRDLDAVKLNEITNRVVNHMM